VHHTAPIWQSLHIQPLTLPELMAQSNAISVQMLYAARYKGFVSSKLLEACKRHQLWVSISRSQLFDESALAEALTDGRIEACVLDGADASFAGADSPLNGLKNLIMTPRLCSHTREARLRASWYVAHRMHEAISQAEAASGLGQLPPSAPMDLELPGVQAADPLKQPELVVR
jgi:D-3-phosphoglycerate dehydrogenase